MEVDGKDGMDRRQRRNRSALLDAGERLFADRSFAGVTIDDIVDAADVAKGTFYNHFGDKEGIAEAIVELVQKDCDRETQSVNKGIGDPALRVARAMAAMIRYAFNHPDRYRSMVNLRQRKADFEAPINAGARRDIELGIECGQFTDITVQGGFLMMLAAIAHAVEFFSSAPKVERKKSLAIELTFILLRSLGVEAEVAKSTSEKAILDLLGDGDYLS